MSGNPARITKPLRLTRQINTAADLVRSLLCSPMDYECNGTRDNPGRFRRITNLQMVRHCADKHQVDLVRVRGWWWLVPHQPQRKD